MLPLTVVQLLLTSSLALASPLASRATTSGPTVTVQNGTLLGRAEPGLHQELYLNIPYAQPPVGDLRLANPLPVNTSYSSSPRPADNWGNICPGTGVSSTPNATVRQFYTLDEDCLNINIFGGGFIQGTANDPRYNGSYLVQRSVEMGEPIIFASINYRLFGFGFPAGQEAADAGVLNLGLKDQRLALHWVQENIGAFGGSSKKVTIFGESAGGMSVVHHMTWRGGQEEGLFSGGIISSGLFATSNSSLASQEPRWQALLNTTGCPTSGSSLACLRALPYETYYAALLNSSYNPAPIPDGDVIQQSNVNAVYQGKVVTKPILIGAVRDEATSGIGAPVGVNNDTAFLSALTRSFSTVLRATSANASIAKIAALYPNENELGCPFETGDGVASSGLQDKRINAVLTDSIHAASRLMASLHSSLASTWSFRFHQVPQNQSIELGVSHSNELPFIFGVQNRTVRSPLGYRAGDLDTSRRFQTYIINFVNHEDPNGAGSASREKRNSDGGDGENLYWPRYDIGQENLILQNNKTRTEKDDYRNEGREFLVQLATGQV